MERNNGFLVATHLFLIKENKILLYLRKGGHQDGMYNLIAGHLDGGEDPREAIIREAKEEAGISISKSDLKFSHVGYSVTGKGKEIIQFYFSCDNWTGEVKNLEIDRCYSMGFFELDKLPENITSYVKQALLDYINKVSYNEYKY